MYLLRDSEHLLSYSSYDSMDQSPPVGLELTQGPEEMGCLSFCPSGETVALDSPRGRGCISIHA